MLLCANGMRTASGPNRLFSGVTTVAGGERTQNIGQYGRMNWSAGWHTVSNETNRSAVPNGARHPVAWLPARKSGGLASRNAGDFAFSTGSLNVAQGRNIAGDTTFAFALPDAQLQLVVSASGTVAVTFTPDATLAGALSASGTSAVTFTVPAVTLGAILNAIAATGITFSPAGLVQAIGHIAGDITPFTELSPEGLAAAVWGAAATSNNVAGSMGEKLNDAGSASNPWTEVIESGLTAAEVLRIIAAALAGDATGLENGSPVFKSLDGSKDRITATYATGTRSVSALDGT
jgi:hypothetical protein